MVRQTQVARLPSAGSREGYNLQSLSVHGMFGAGVPKRRE